MEDDELAREVEADIKVFGGEPDPESDSRGRLVYSGPSASLVFEGVEFPLGVPVEAESEMIERLAAHPLASEGHRLTPE